MSSRADAEKSRALRSSALKRRTPKPTKLRSIRRGSGARDVQETIAIYIAEIDGANLMQSMLQMWTLIPIRIATMGGTWQQWVAPDPIPAGR